MNEPARPQARLLLKAEEAASVLGVGRTQVYALIASGQLHSVRIGRLRRVPYRACQEYVDRLAADQAETCDALNS